MRYNALFTLLALFLNFQHLTAQQTSFYEEVSKLYINIPDFLVNDDQGNAWQGSPSISIDGSSNFVITWADGRDGNAGIYAQRYASDGSPMGSEFKVNDNIIQTSQGSPTISADFTGNFVITWHDERNGNSDIYAQCYTSDGYLMGANFKVNDDPGTSWQESPHISMNSSGYFVVTWRDMRNVSGIPDIYAQRYTSNGSPLGINFKVNDDQGNTWQWDPSIATDDNGNFVITWTDGRNGNSDIYAQRYSSDGNPLDTNFRVSNDTTHTNKWSPSISTDSNGNFVITWNDDSENPDIYAQRFASDGSLLGTNFIVNDDTTQTQQSSPSISIDGSGNFILAWTDGRNENKDIYAQCYTSIGTPVGINFKVDDDPGGNWQESPHISMHGDGNFVITWMDRRNENWDIYAQRFANNGGILGTNFKVNYDPSDTYQGVPSITIDGSSNFVITWWDKRNGNPDIYAQRYINNGTLIGNNFKVNDDLGSGDQWCPSITTDSSGNFMIAWTDGRNGDSNIYAQRYSSNGSPLGNNFKVNDDQGNAGQNRPSLSSTVSGNFIITWEDTRNGSGNRDIYAQRYNSNGSKIGSNFIVNDNLASIDHWSSVICLDRIGNFVIAWTDERNGDYDIYAQRYANDGNPLGSNFKVNDDQGSAYPVQYSPAISTDPIGNFIVTWTDERNGVSDIYAQRYSSDGSPLGNNFRVNDDPGYTPQWWSSISVDKSGNFVITWTDERNGSGDPDIYAQRYASDGSQLGNNFRLTNTSEGVQEEPSVKLWNGLIYGTWRDYREGRYDSDIWANVLDWFNPVGTGDKKLPPVSKTFILRQNYPNPFNPVTTIEFDLPRSSEVTLKVFNILGEEVTNLLSAFMLTGSHSVNWDASNLASGVYLYRLEADGYVQTRKMILMK